MSSLENCIIEKLSAFAVAGVCERRRDKKMIKSFVFKKVKMKSVE